MLDDLENKIRKDLERVNIPAKKWVIHSKEDPAILDVAIIGAGMGGKCAALALMKQGIDHFKIFDANEKGKEGPWLNYARMHQLRSDKHDLGPCLGLPSLTFRAWYAAKYGEEAEQKLVYAPTKIWSDYLQWFGEVLNLPIQNRKKLSKIIPDDGHFKLHFQDEIVKARKVILATGQDGSGGCNIPKYMEGVSRSFYRHSGEIFKTDDLKRKKIAIVGAGASAFDLAVVAQEVGAEQIHMVIRRPDLPVMNEFSEFAFQGILEGYYHLEKMEKCHFFTNYLCGAPPPAATISRIKSGRDFCTQYGCHIQRVVESGNCLQVHTNLGVLEVDLLLFGTGFSVNLSQREELSSCLDSILLWDSCVSEEFSHLGSFPQLGPSFEFLEKPEACAPYLKNIYCFNNGAAMSHGLISNDIPGVSIGAERLAKGIATDFFLKESSLYLEAALNQFEILER